MIPQGIFSITKIFQAGVMAICTTVLVVRFLLYMEPYSVMVGTHRVTLVESKEEVLFKNKTGNKLGFGRCNITGLSFYWTPFTVLMYDSSRGVIFSKYAVDKLLELEEQEAYDIAQKAFEQLQKRSWSKKSLKKLIFPLLTMRDSILIETSPNVNKTE